LHDAAGILGDVNSLFTFAKSLIAITKITIGAAANLHRQVVERNEPGTKTVETLMNLAVKSSSTVNLRYEKNAKGDEKLSLKVTPQEARTAQSVLKKSKEIQRRVARVRGLSAPKGISLESYTTNDALISGAVARIGKLDFNKTGLDLKTIVDAVAATLGPDATRGLDLIANKLESDGQHQAAAMFRAGIKKDGAYKSLLNPPNAT
jgi:YbbR domain-containing protein